MNQPIRITTEIARLLLEAQEWTFHLPQQEGDGAQLPLFGAGHSRVSQFREWLPAFAVFTLPPHPRFSHIHDKSLPLMLEPRD